jgi:hypothetical protein
MSVIGLNSGKHSNATRTIPIVGIDLEIDPAEAGLVASIARPGGNITGLFLDLSELSGKHLQILKEIIPGTSRVAVLGRPDINAAQRGPIDQVCPRICPARASGSIPSIKPAPAAAACSMQSARPSARCSIMYPLGFE